MVKVEEKEKKRGRNEESWHIGRKWGKGQFLVVSFTRVMGQARVTRRKSDRARLTRYRLLIVLRDSDLATADMTRRFPTEEAQMKMA